jgi:Rad3-related DNA helicase
MKPRNQRLREALRKFTSETLKPMELTELAPLMRQFPSGLADKYSQMLIDTIQRNCMDEFETIIQETNLTEKLDQLDDLTASATGFDVSMASFDFRHADPDVVKRAIVRQVKQREIELLKEMLGALEKENAGLEERNSAAVERLRQIDGRIEESKRRINL